MSRLGKKPIDILQGVTVEIGKNRGFVNISGPKGLLTRSLPRGILVDVEEGKLVVKPSIQQKNTSALWGLTRTLLANMVEGVTKGYEKKLELSGVGYRVKQDSKDSIILTVGFSHPVEFKSPEGIALKIEDNQHITVSGIDKELVGLVAANIRKIRKPEPYKGKGIKYAGEVIRRKQGKAGKVQ